MKIFKALLITCALLAPSMAMEEDNPKKGTNGEPLRSATVAADYSGQVQLKYGPKAKNLEEMRKELVRIEVALSTYLVSSQEINILASLTEQELKNLKPEAAKELNNML